MDGSIETTTSSSAIVERKPQATGGCVGIFFQLFEWNRRLSKNKFFSKKFLPPVRSKQGSKKNGGDEKHSKHRLVADENSGGFPNMKKNRGLTNIDLVRKHEMRAPGLVARLMGLESMPVLQRQKPKIVQVSGYGSNRPEKFVDNECDHEGGVLNAEISGSKQLRPQKLQKTSFNERLPMTPFGDETQPFKNVLLKSRKHHHKLPTPVKSPRNLSKKNASKLIGAATRILEPGLQTSRSKSSLTYPKTLYDSPKRQSVLDKECFGQVPDVLSNQREDSSSVAFKGHQSCPNCGRCMDNLGYRPCVSDQPLVFNLPSSHCAGLSGQESEETKLGEPTFYQELEDKLQGEYPLAAAPFMGYERPCVWHKAEQSSFSGHVSEPWMDDPLSCSSNSKTQNQNQISRLRNSVPSRSNLNSLSRDKISLSDSVTETRNFASLNQSSSRVTRSHSLVVMANGKFVPGRCIENRQNDLVLQGRKRRPVNISRQGEQCPGLSSTANKHTYPCPHSMSGNEIGANVHSDNHQRSKTAPHGLQERRVGSGQGDQTSVPFRFTSPSKQKPGFPALTKRRVQNDSANDDDSSGLNENNLRKRFEKPPPLCGDALGVLLEEKLKELTWQSDDVGGNEAKKTTAMILQELINALTSEIPFQPDKSSVVSKREPSSLGHLPCSKFSTSYQANTGKVKRSVDQLVESDRLSPGSVLEAYSCDTSLSSSQGDTFENLDSLTSINSANTSKQLVANIINNVSEIFRCLNLANCGLKGTKLDHANNVILNAELAIGNVAPTGSVVQRKFSIKHLLVEELETLATVLWMNFGCSLGVEDGKEANQLRTFALDSIIEFLDSRFGRYLNLGTTLSQELPLCLNINTVFSDIVEDVRKWEESSRFVFDDLIEREMSCSVVEWTRFRTERFETALEISRHLLQNLVEEIVMDS
ncbi:hypothetical protein F511_37347 [Dorcoceras hygrometricum]|uniref:DUF3741 domain-containing protein n=1 Tax=Dorcoceras hygrometricum TaxID=472368 RepID=A0A2Z7CFQ0_9LAMI|nr:hypothetical protein F511_37347 [Dorcoceras hygrometricum]